jgi:hypothetical protein
MKKWLDPDPGFGMKKWSNPIPGSGMKQLSESDPGSGIKHPGSATLDDLFQMEGSGLSCHADLFLQFARSVREKFDELFRKTTYSKRKTAGWCRHDDLFVQVARSVTEKFDELFRKTTYSKRKVLAGVVMMIYLYRLPEVLRRSLTSCFVRRPTLNERFWLVLS